LGEPSEEATLEVNMALKALMDAGHLILDDAEIGITTEQEQAAAAAATGDGGWPITGGRGRGSGLDGRGARYARFARSSVVSRPVPERSARSSVASRPVHARSLSMWDLSLSRLRAKRQD
jgi:hypothetical protein